ncbi:MAG TPA: AI-2E family transporter [Casimicrobiaceae bacterium]|nr:AI-2E family transporter [Casimicrobiaceae bacterium]
MRPHEIALILIAVVIVLTAAKLAADFLVPVVLGILLAYALEPPVEAVARLGVPRGIAGALVLLTVVAAVGGTGWWLRHDVAEVVAELPGAARQLREAVRSDGRKGALAHVQEAAAELEKAAAEAQGKAPVPKLDPTPPVADLSKQLAGQGIALIEIVGQLAIAFTIALFLLASGDTFRRKLVKVVGSSLAERRVTVEILNEIDVQVQRYLWVMLITNVLLAAACWPSYMLLGFERPALWAIVTGVLHFIPYVGGVMAAFVVGAAALIETGLVSAMVWAWLITMALVAILGMGFNTWLQGRTSKMNPVAVFVIVLMFGWLWGGWGLLLGAPLAAVLKTIADRIEGLGALAELLGEARPAKVVPAAAAEAGSETLKDAKPDAKTS